MTIQPGVHSKPMDSSTQSSIWNRYEKVLVETKKHVDAKIATLGFKGIVFEKDTIKCDKEKVFIQVTFKGVNNKEYTTQICLNDKIDTEFNVPKLTQILVTQAVAFSIQAINAAVERAKSITDRNIVLLQVDEPTDNFILACFDETTVPAKDSGEALIMEIPKSSVILWTPGRIALEIVKFLAKGFGCEEKLESDWKGSLNISQ